MSRAKTTAIQARIIAYMREFLAEEDRMPSTREIAERFDWCQSNSILHLRRMTAKGLLEYRLVDGKRGWWRFRREEAKP